MTILTLSFLALQAQAPAPGAPRAQPAVFIIYIVMFGLIAYFLLLRPQRKVQQQHQQMVSALKKGDEVMTDGGIIGTIVHMSDDRLTIRSGENTRLIVSRGKIARVLTSTAATE